MTKGPIIIIYGPTGVGKTDNPFIIIPFYFIFFHLITYNIAYKIIIGDSSTQPNTNLGVEE